MPNVRVTVSRAGTLTPYARKLEFVTAAVAVLTEILNAAPLPTVSSKLAIVIDEMIAELPDGTVYSVVNTFVDGFD
jgi:hypothetical protein